MYMYKHMYMYIQIWLHNTNMHNVCLYTHCTCTCTYMYVCKYTCTMYMSVTVCIQNILINILHHDNTCQVIRSERVFYTLYLVTSLRHSSHLTHHTSLITPHITPLTHHTSHLLPSQPAPMQYMYTDVHVTSLWNYMYMYIHVVHSRSGVMDIGYCNFLILRRIDVQQSMLSQ